LQLDLNPATGALVDLEELDAMEFWGATQLPAPTFTDDATFFSLKGDSSDSVHHFDSGSTAPFISRAEIHNALASLGFVGVASNVDVDALMCERCNV
jgi:hypothetical protein